MSGTPKQVPLPKTQPEQAVMTVEAILARERRGRLNAERRLAVKEAELLEANRLLDARALSLRKRAIRTEARAEAAERDRDDAGARAALSERLLWDALEAIRDGFALYGADGRMIMANRAFLRPFAGLKEVGPGIAYDRLLALMCEEGLIDLDDTGASEWIDMMRHRLMRSPIEDQPIRLFDGTEVRLVDRRTVDGNMVTLALDVTAANRREAELAEVRRAAESASAAKSAFLTAMSHELRTPLNGVVGTAELLGDTALNPDQRLLADTIRSSGEVLLEMVNDVLDFSRIEAGRLELKKSPIEIRQIAREVADLIRPQVNAARVRFDLEIGTMPEDLVGDGGRIRQILLNLVGYAAKFAEEGCLRMVIRGRPAGSRAEIAVEIADTGPGIPEAEHAAILEDFNRAAVEGARPAEGSGLGLAITRRLVAAMGGRIAVQSTPGEGTRFTVTMHLDRMMPKPAPTSRLRVLAAEDNRTNRMIFERMLTKLPVDLVIVENGGLAMDRFAEGRWDLVFLDISMPVMDGRNVARSMREHEAKKGQARTPILAMTAHVLPDEVGVIKAAGIDEVLFKPLRREHLEQAITRARSIVQPDSPSTARKA